MGHNAAMEESKNICHEKGKGAINYDIITRRLKKFHLDYKNLNNLVKSGRPKSIGFHDIEANPASNTGRVSDKLNISQSSVVHNFDKSIQICLMLPKYSKTLDC